MLIADKLLRMDSTTVGGDLLAVLTVAAMSLQLDLGGRPSETLELTREHVVEPQRKRFPQYGLRFHPMIFKKASKSQQYDDTVFSRTTGERAFYAKILPVLRGATRPGERLLPSENLLGGRTRVAHKRHAKTHGLLRVLASTLRCAACAL